MAMLMSERVCVSTVGLDRMILSVDLFRDAPRELMHDYKCAVATQFHTSMLFYGVFVS